MKNCSGTKRTKRILSIFISLVFMFAGMLTASAQVVVDENFSSTQYELFGKQFGASYEEGKYVINADTINVNNLDAVTFFSVEDGRGVMTKIGNRGNYNTMGFDISFADNIKAKQFADWQQENPEATDEEKTAAYETLSGKITSGVWNFDFSEKTPNGRQYYTFQNNGTDVLSFRGDKWVNNTGVFASQSTAENLTENDRYSSVDRPKYGHMIINNNGTNDNIIRLQLDFDNNTLNIYRDANANGNWLKINGFNNDENGNPKGDNTTVTDAKLNADGSINLTAFGVDLKKGIDSFSHKQIFHGNPCISSFGFLKLAKNDDNTYVVYDADFEDNTKTWEDYGCVSNSKYGTAWLDDNMLYLKATKDVNNEPFTIDYAFDAPVTSGIWAVDFKMLGIDKNGGSIAPCAASGNFNKNRSFLQILNGTADDGLPYVELGIASAYNYAHMYGVSIKNNALVSTNSVDYFNEGFRKPNGSAAEFITNAGADYRFVFDLNEHKLYAYATYNGSNGYVCMNPEGYTLDSDFSMDKIRISSLVVTDRMKLSGIGNFKVTKIDSADSYSNIDTYVNGNPSYTAGVSDASNIYVGQGSTIKTDATIFTPSENKDIKFITVIYDGSGKVKDVRMISKKTEQGMSVISDEFAVTEDIDGCTVKTFIWDSGLKPFSKDIEYMGTFAQ